MSPRKSGPCNHNSYFKSLVIIRLTTLRPSSLSVIYCSVAFRRQRRIIKEKKHMTPIEALISQTRNTPSEDYHVTCLAYAEVMVISSYLPKDTLTFVILGNQNFYFLCFKIAHELGVCSLTCSLLCRHRDECRHEADVVWRTRRKALRLTGLTLHCLLENRMTAEGGRCSQLMSLGVCFLSLSAAVLPPLRDKGDLQF